MAEGTCTLTFGGHTYQWPVSDVLDLVGIANHVGVPYDVTLRTMNGAPVNTVRRNGVYLVVKKRDVPMNTDTMNLLTTTSSDDTVPTQDASEIASVAENLLISIDDDKATYFEIPAVEPTQNLLATLFVTQDKPFEHLLEPSPALEPPRSPNPPPSPKMLLPSHNELQEAMLRRSRRLESMGTAQNGMLDTAETSRSTVNWSAMERGHNQQSSNTATTGGMANSPSADEPETPTIPGSQFRDAMSRLSFSTIPRRKITASGNSTPAPPTPPPINANSVPSTPGNADSVTETEEMSQFKFAKTRLNLDQLSVRKQSDSEHAAGRSQHKTAKNSPETKTVAVDAPAEVLPGPSTTENDELMEEAEDDKPPPLRRTASLRERGARARNQSRLITMDAVLAASAGSEEEPAPFRRTSSLRNPARKLIPPKSSMPKLAEIAEVDTLQYTSDMPSTSKAVEILDQSVDLSAKSDIKYQVNEETDVTPDTSDAADRPIDELKKRLTTTPPAMKQLQGKTISQDDHLLVQSTSQPLVCQNVAVDRVPEVAEPTTSMSFQKIIEMSSPKPITSSSIEASRTRSVHSLVGELENTQNVPTKAVHPPLIENSDITPKEDLRAHTVHSLIREMEKPEGLLPKSGQTSSSSNTSSSRSTLSLVSEQERLAHNRAAQLYEKIIRLSPSSAVVSHSALFPTSASTSEPTSNATASYPADWSIPKSTFTTSENAPTRATEVPIDVSAVGPTEEIRPSRAATQDSRIPDTATPANVQTTEQISMFQALTNAILTNLFKNNTVESQQASAPGDQVASSHSLFDHLTAGEGASSQAHTTSSASKVKVADAKDEATGRPTAEKTSRSADQLKELENLLWIHAQDDRVKSELRSRNGDLENIINETKNTYRCTACHQLSCHLVLCRNCCRWVFCQECFGDRQTQQTCPSCRIIWSSPSSYQKSSHMADQVLNLMIASPEPEPVPTAVSSPPEPPYRDASRITPLKFAVVEANCWGLPNTDLPGLQGTCQVTGDVYFWRKQPLRRKTAASSLGKKGMNIPASPPLTKNKPSEGVDNVAAAIYQALDGVDPFLLPFSMFLTSSGQIHRITKPKKSRPDTAIWYGLMNIPNAPMPTVYVVPHPDFISNVISTEQLQFNENIVEVNRRLAETEASKQDLEATLTVLMEQLEELAQLSNNPPQIVEIPAENNELMTALEVFAKSVKEAYRCNICQYVRDRQVLCLGCGRWVACHPCYEIMKTTEVGERCPNCRCSWANNEKHVISNLMADVVEKVNTLVADD